MALTEGLSANIRQLAPDEPEPPEAQDFEIGGDQEDDGREYDAKGNVISVKFADGSIDISLDGSPLEKAANDGAPKDWFSNLVEEIDEQELARIADNLLRGIQDDLQSRSGWTEDRANGLRMLGLKLNVPGTTGAAEGAPVEGMSTVRHPLMMKAVLNFQANARSELLPTDGPAKIRDDSNNVTDQEDKLADAYEKDLNHYLTVVAKEYYPDTDRMLFMTGFGGMGIKKVYFCPLRNRPVSESIDADDFIVNNSATDIKNAKRATHRVMMSPNTVKRLQILGVYRDIELSDAKVPQLDAAQQEKKDQQGISAESFHPEDRDRPMFECYCELNIQGFEHEHKGKQTGLEIPYRVTIDETSRRILAVVRDYDEDTQDLPEKRTTFVKYPFIPALGFYDVGFVHILGNTTNALTAAWREMLDAGMFACFPGFLIADAGGRQNTNIFRIPPGGGQLVKTGGQPIGQAVMPLPYKEPSTALMQLIDGMAQTGEKLAGVADLQVGEGTAQMPVGTVLAVIEQATKVENAIHKRLHSAQAEELQLLVECFRQHPESFWQRNRKPALKWDQETFQRALDTFDLIPQADPNTSSHTQRIMKAVALKQMQTMNPTQYDGIAVDTDVLQTIGFSNPERFFAKSPAPNPQAQKDAAQAQAQTIAANARMLDAQTKAKTAQAQIQQGLSGGKTPDELAIAKQANDIKQQGQDFEQQRAGIEDQNRDEDRQADLLEASMRLQGDLVKQKQDHIHDHAMKAHEALNQAATPPQETKQ